MKADDAQVLNQVARLTGDLAEMKAQNARLIMLFDLFGAICEPQLSGVDDPLVRLTEAAHKHGRKLEREEIASVLRERAKYALNSGTTELETAADLIEARR